MKNLNYKNEELSFEERAKALVSNMTIEEKVSQIMHTAIQIDRLGIPSYNWWNEALHGVARAGVATVFPQAIGLAATFDEDLIFKVGDVISTEARAKYNEFQRKDDHGIYKGLTFWSPNVNIFRDPRWGRGQETYGEDPFLTGKLGVAFVKGLQGSHKKYLKVAACAKHFAVHSGPEKERHSFNAVISKKDLYETYLPAFKECVKSGHVESVMGAYNRTNGEPCCGSKTLLNDVLRNSWGFKGHVVSDCGAIADFHEHHKITKSGAESSALALKNGCDLNCGCTYSNVFQALDEGLITEEDVDKSVIRLFTTRMKLGMFDNPCEVPYSSIPYEKNDCKEHRDFSLEVSKKSIVLLKNNGILPLKKEEIKSIAVIGPNANSKAVLEGNYCGTASEYVTILDGIRKTVSDDTRIYYAEGCHLYKDRTEGLGEIGDRLNEAVSAAERSDVVILCLGIDATLEGEEGDASNEYGSGDKINLNLPGQQSELMEMIYKTGKPVILVINSGSALNLSFADENIPSIIQSWYPGAQGGKAVASLIFGEYSPSGRLPITFYRTIEELPDFNGYSMMGRTYRYMKNEALYPFGYGLSFTKFEYSNLASSSNEINTNENINFSIKVKNTGNFPSEEVVQLYLKDLEASCVVPNYELRGVKKIFLNPNEEKEIEFTLSPRDLALINDEGKCILEPGEFKVYIGGSAPDKRSEFLTKSKVLDCNFNVIGTSTELEY